LGSPCHGAPTPEIARGGEGGRPHGSEQQPQIQDSNKNEERRVIRIDRSEGAPKKIPINYNKIKITRQPVCNPKKGASERIGKRPTREAFCDDDDDDGRGQRESGDNPWVLPRSSINKQIKAHQADPSRIRTYLPRHKLSITIFLFCFTRNKRGGEIREKRARSEKSRTERSTRSQNEYQRLPRGHN
jgi:hypothetical protein